MDRFDEIRDWLADDFERRGADSLIVAWCFDQGRESFRVRAKRLLREALLDARRRRQLLAFLLRELIDHQRLTGKRSGGDWRYEPMVDDPTLGPLLALGRERPGKPSRTGQRNAAVSPDAHRQAKEVRKGLVAAQEALQVNPAAVQDLAWEDIVALARAMLAADHVPDRRSSLETALELCEDALWPEGTVPWPAGASDARDRLMSDEFADLFDKVAAGEREHALDAARRCTLAGNAEGSYRALRALAVARVGQQELLNLGIRKGGTGEGHRRKSTIDPGLLLRYFDAQQKQEGDDEVWKDLLDLYFATYRDKRCRRLLIPVTIDDRTGIGVYLMGVERYGVYVPEPDCGSRNVTVAIIDHHLAEPANQTFIAQDRGRFRGKGVLMLYPGTLSFDQALGSSTMLRRVFVGRILKDLRDQYDLRVQRSLERSFRPAQGVDRAPEGCPPRFRAYFDQ